MGLAALRRKLDVPIATDENEFTKWGFRELFEVDAVDYLMPDIMRCGGITVAHKVCALAEAFEVTVTTHSFATGVGLAATLQVTAICPACEWLEFDGTDFPLYEALLVTDLEIDNGQVTVPTAPGLGVELTDDLIADYGIE